MTLSFLSAQYFSEFKYLLKLSSQVHYALAVCVNLSVLQFVTLQSNACVGDTYG